MHINLRRRVKKKSVVWAVITFIIFAYNVFDVWSNLEFIGQKSGVLWQGAYLLFGTATGARTLLVIAMGVFMFTLLFEFKSDEQVTEQRQGEDSSQSKTPEATTSDPQVPPATERIIVDVTPEHLMKFFDEHTNIQAQRLIEAYIGKWIRVSGVVTNVVRERDNTQVFLTLSPGKLAFAYFREDKWIRRVEVLRRDVTVTILGEIRSVSELTMFLDDCEVSDLSPIESEGGGSKALEAKSITNPPEVRANKPSPNIERKGTRSTRLPIDPETHRITALSYSGEKNNLIAYLAKFYYTPEANTPDWIDVTAHIFFYVNGILRYEAFEPVWFGQESSKQRFKRAESHELIITMGELDWASYECGYQVRDGQQVFLPYYHAVFEYGFRATVELIIEREQDVTKKTFNYEFAIDQRPNYMPTLNEV